MCIYLQAPTTVEREKNHCKGKGRNGEASKGKQEKDGGRRKIWKGKQGQEVEGKNDVKMKAREGRGTEGRMRVAGLKTGV